jgi:hypothetical protein
MKRWVTSLLTILCSLVLAASAHAATAGFAGACLANSGNTQLNCTFNAGRSDFDGNYPPSSCPNNGTPTYSWDWGDNSNPLWTSSSVVSHSYALPIVSGSGAPYGYFVSLSVFCPDNSSATLTRYICVYGFGVAGCIHTDGGYW